METGFDEGQLGLCPYCLTTVANSSATQCETCGSAHHTACINENGGCAVLGCRTESTDVPVTTPEAQTPSQHTYLAPSIPEAGQPAAPQHGLPPIHPASHEGVVGPAHTPVASTADNTLSGLDEKWARWSEDAINMVTTSVRSHLSPGLSAASASAQPATSDRDSSAPEASAQGASTPETADRDPQEMAVSAQPGASHWVSSPPQASASTEGLQGANVDGTAADDPPGGMGPGPIYDSAADSAPPQTAPSKSWLSNNRVLMGAGAGAVAVLALGGMIAAASGPSTITVDYSLTLDESCYSTSFGYSDIDSTTQVEVVDGSGTLLGSSYLGTGTSSGYGSCKYSTTFTAKSSSDDLYRVTAGNSRRGYLNYDESDLVSDTLTINATLG